MGGRSNRRLSSTTVGSSGGGGAGSATSLIGGGGGGGGSGRWHLVAAGPNLAAFAVVLTPALPRIPPRPAAAATAIAAVASIALSLVANESAAGPPTLLVGWQGYGRGYTAAPLHVGGAVAGWALVARPTVLEGAGGMRVIDFPTPLRARFVVSAWARTGDRHHGYPGAFIGAAGRPRPHTSPLYASLYCDVYYSDGSHDYGVRARVDLPPSAALNPPPPWVVIAAVLVVLLLVVGSVLAGAGGGGTRDGRARP